MRTPIDGKHAKGFEWGRLEKIVEAKGQTVAGADLFTDAEMLARINALVGAMVAGTPLPEPVDELQVRQQAIREQVEDELAKARRRLAAHRRAQEAREAEAKKGVA